MARYAILTNNIVTNIIIASAKEVEREGFDAVEVSTESLVGIGWVRNPETGEIVETIPSPDIPTEES